MTMRRRRVFLSIMGSALLLTGLWVRQHDAAALRPLDSLSCQRYVGGIRGKHCRPGRRWGCDPQNFGQSGCTPIDNPIVSCRARGWLEMACTPATCERSNPEHLCSVDYETVGRNVCHPTGERTTHGCPEDQWQCKVEMIDHTHENAPTADVLVCRYDVSTICDHDYSDCD
jgi:hypothetical protein